MDNKFFNQTINDIRQDTPTKYCIIYADPPWRQSKGGKKSVRPESSGEALDYPVISLTEIKQHLSYFVNKTEENSILFLWTIDKYLHEAEVMAIELGYKLHARMIWNKITGIPAAFTIRYGHEYLLYMYKGKLIPVATNERGKIHSVFSEQVKRHSQKPEIAYQIIERLYPSVKKIELYARNSRDGWDAWGNEIEKSCDISEVSANNKDESDDSYTIIVSEDEGFSQKTMFDMEE